MPVPKRRTMLNFRKDLYADVRIEDRFTTSIRYRDGAL